MTGQRAESEEPLLDFDQALVLAEHVHSSPNPSLLIGNGFSQEFSDKFGYKALREKAPLTSLTPGVRKDDLFDHAGTNDFETVIRTLERAADLHDLYDKGGPLQTKLREDAELVKNGLVDALVAIHPSSAAEIQPARYAPARSFLSNFSVVFTLNYDLLLYWTINQQASLSNRTPREDGFRLRHNVLTWTSRGLPDTEVLFLHGAMHLYAEDSQTHKLSGRGGHIINQVQENLDSGRYPLVVTEGSRENKQARIAVNPYLSHCYSRLERLRGTLFIHGASLSDNDQHILDAICDSGVEALFVSLFGNESDYRDVKHRAEGIVVERQSRGGRPLDVYFYQSDTAEVWG